MDKNKMIRYTKRTFILAAMLLVAAVAKGQQGTTAAPDYSAILDLRNGANKGLLLPQVALTDTGLMAPVSSKPSGNITPGLLVYNTNTSTANGLSGKGYYYWDSTGTTTGVWVYCHVSDWVITGNAGTSSGINFLGPTDSVSLRVRTNNLERMVMDSLGNVGVGVSNAGLTAPLLRLQVDSSVAFGPDTTGVNNYLYWNSKIGSLAAGKQNAAPGTNAMALGLLNTASGNNALAIGNNNSNTASGADGNVIVGYRHSISGTANASVAIGFADTITTGSHVVIGNRQPLSGTADSTVAIGNSNRANAGANHLLLGTGNKMIATGNTNYAMGVSNVISGTAANGMAIGNLDTVNNGANNMALGYLNKISPVNNITNGNYVLGYNNKVTGNADTGNVSAVLGNNNSLSASGNSGSYILGNGNVVSSDADWVVAIGAASIPVTTTSQSVSAKKNIAIGSVKNTITGMGNLAITSKTNTISGTGNLVLGNSGTNNLSGNNNIFLQSNGTALSTNSSILMVPGGGGIPTAGHVIALSSQCCVSIGDIADSFSVIFDGHVTGSGSVGTAGPGTFSTFFTGGYHYYLSGISPTLPAMTINKNPSDSDYATLHIYKVDGYGSLLVDGGATITGTTYDYISGLSFGLNVTGNIATDSNIAAGANIVTDSTITAVGDISTDGDLYAGGILISSDRRLKKDIAGLPSGLKSLSELRGVHYYWNDAARARHMPGMQLGMIAQELEAVYPELVFTNAKTGYKTVNYVQFTAVLLQDLKEQQSQLAVQQQQLTDKEATLNKLLTELNSLEKEVIEIGKAIKR